jgi:7,8-dihydro-6-hydroxymethylpterin-pyrophosphokinase
MRLYPHKDPYNLDFIMLGEEAKERDLEDALMTHVTKLLLELGDGFAFMGRQRRFEAGGREFFIDLLFYHTKLRRHIIIELKIGEFEPEYVSKMNLYLGLADDQLKGEFDQPAIGLILCKTKNKIVAEYALRDTSKPIGIAEYKISQMLPEDIKGELPSIEDIEHKLDEEINENLNPVDARLKSIKEKIKSLNTPVIQTECTHQILQNIFDNGLKPLYQKIIQKFNSEFGAEFLSQQLNWRVSGKIVYGIDDLVNILKEEKDLTKISEIEFNYTFLRFKRGGTEDLNEHITLKFTVSSTWYGFSIVNYNNQQPFLKKMYHEDITVSDHQLIMDLMVSKVLDQIEWMIEKINGTK